MNLPAKKLLVVSAAAFLLAGTVGAKQAILKETRHRAIEPEVYIPLREEMTRMEIKFVDLQIMASKDEIDYQAVRKALEDMEAASKKIRKVNPSDALQEPLKKLTGQIERLQRDANRKDRTAFTNNLDRLFETCFKCHQAHAPLM